MVFLMNMKALSCVEILVGERLEEAEVKLSRCCGCAEDARDVREGKERDLSSVLVHFSPTPEQMLHLAWTGKEGLNIMLCD